MAKRPADRSAGLVRDGDRSNAIAPEEVVSRRGVQRLGHAHESGGGHRQRRGSNQVREGEGCRGGSGKRGVTGGLGPVLRSTLHVAARRTHPRLAPGLGGALGTAAAGGRGMGRPAKRGRGHSQAVPQTGCNQDDGDTRVYPHFRADHITPFQTGSRDIILNRDIGWGA